MRVRDRVCDLSLDNEPGAKTQSNPVKLHLNSQTSPSTAYKKQSNFNCVYFCKSEASQGGTRQGESK